MFLGIAARTVVVIALGGDDNERLCVLVSFPLTLGDPRGRKTLCSSLLKLCFVCFQSRRRLLVFRLRCVTKQQQQQQRLSLSLSLRVVSLCACRRRVVCASRVKSVLGKRCVSLFFLRRSCCQIPPPPFFFFPFFSPSCPPFPPKSPPSPLSFPPFFANNGSSSFDDANTLLLGAP